MKKLLLLMVASMFVLGDVALARVDSEKGQQMMCYTCGKSMKKCKCKKEKIKRAKAPKHEKAKKAKAPKKEKAHKEKVRAPKKEKSYKAKPKKEHKPKEHRVKEHKPKAHKEHKVKEHKPKKEKVHHEKPQKAKKMKAHKEKMRNEDKKHEKRQAAHAKKRKHEEKARRHNLKDEAKRAHKKESAQAKKENAERKEIAMRAEQREEARRRHQDVNHERKERRQMIARWDNVHADADHRDLMSGKHADLFSLPAVPSYGYWYEGKNFVNVGVHYDYACNAYGSDGGSSNRNITQLAFGEKQITFDDICLASKLVNAGKLNATDAGDLTGIRAATNQNITLIGKDERYQLDLEVGRYVINRDVAIGVNVPVLYNKHRLKTNLGLSDPVAHPIVADRPDLNNVAVQTALTSLLQAKGLQEMGGSAMGMGDLSMYANYQINSVYFDKLVLGFRGVVPTAKKPSNSKLWAPELGNGGFFQASVYGSVLMNYQKYLNPSVMLEVGMCAPAHVGRRVPRLVTVDTVAAGAGTPTQTQFDAAETVRKSLAFGDRVALLRADGTAAAVAADGNGLLGFSDYDTTVRGFADQVQQVRITKGPELKLRVGNTMERFICPRGFMSVFYDFRAKGHDKASGLSTSDFNVGILTNHTVELEHNVGVEYSYQHDLYTRTHLGFRYTFAGMNVPKTFELGGSLNHAF